MERAEESYSFCDRNVSSQIPWAERLHDLGYDWFRNIPSDWTELRDWQEWPKIKLQDYCSRNGST